MANYKLIAADLDGTVLDDTYAVSGVLKEYVARARERGTELVIATGRLFPSALPFVKELEVTLPVIASNGAVVKTPLDGNMIYHVPLDKNLAGEVLDFTKDYPVQRFLNINDIFYTDAPEEQTIRYSEALKVQFTRVEPLEQMLTEAPTMVVIRGKDEIIKELTDHMRDHFGERAYLANSKPFFIDVNHPAVSKGAALAKLCQHLKIDLSQVIAIGDGWNDLEMFRLTGLGAAVANAPEDLKREADYVCENETYQGVIEVIEKFVL